MPTHQDETLPQRYAREYQDYLKLCGSMTAEQVADLQSQLNNALAREQALQHRLTAADERADTATSLIQRIVANFDTEIEYHEDVEPNDLEHDQVLTEMREFLAGNKPAARPQGEPVVLTNAQRRAADYKEQQAFNDWAWNKQGEAIGRMDGQAAAIEAWHARAKLAEQPAPVEVVPDGYCIMPRQLTAENGAKALLLGEFKLLVTKECPECCELEEPTEGCSICDGEGEYGQKHTIPWDQLKYIYSKAVSGLAVKTESAKSR